jgi:archaellum component FlaC
MLFIAVIFKRVFLEIITSNLLWKIMKNKKGVIGVFGTILIVLMVIAFNISGNLAEERSGEDHPKNVYDEMVDELNNTLRIANENNNKIGSIDRELDAYRMNIEEMLEDYENLGENIRESLEGVRRLGNEVNRVQSGSGNIEVELEDLKNEVEEIRGESGVRGFRIDFMSMAIFIFINFLVWLQISSYYRSKNQGSYQLLRK